ncbi:uncharacterized protein [Primulina eburnea]|uniref:uncharacterized protein isoform X2 n=1 Tax=Primulina eburnea TaxID=1245227 RepID=UPI003C6CB179
MRALDWNSALEFSNKMLDEKPLLPLVVPLLLVLWTFEKWFFPLSNWIALILAVWVTIQPVTPLEQCEWLNKLLIDIWPNYINPKLSSRFSSIIERRLKHRKSKLIEKIELQEFSLGARPPLLGLQGIRWTTSGDQRVMRLGFDWDTTDINILLFAKLTTPLMGTARIIVNSIHVKGDLLLVPVLDGKAIVYSFVSIPEVRIGVAFGSGGSQSLPATELPGVSSWLVKIATDTFNKKMVEPRRQCLALPAVDLQKKAVGGVLYVTVVSASKLRLSDSRGSPSTKQTGSLTDTFEDGSSNTEIRTILEIELEELTRKTKMSMGSNPKWGSTFNLILHDNAGTVKFNLYECTPGSVKYGYLSSCEIKMRYAPDDSTLFWAIGTDSLVMAKHAEFCGKEVEMTIPFEGVDSGELTVKLVLKEWHFSDGTHSPTNFGRGSFHPVNVISNYSPKTGRKIHVTVVEGKDLVVKDKMGKSDPYVKLQYGKVIQRTKSVSRSSNPIWNQKFEFDEIGGGEYLRIRCCTDETFSDENIGSARVNLEGLVEGSIRDVCIPLEKVSSGELQLQIEAVKVADTENSKGSHASSWIEIVLIEARDLVAADLRGTSDPFVSVNYGNLKRRTKVIFKTLDPKWHQTFEFPDDGSPLELHVKDHNALLPPSNIGDCVVEYQMLAPNQMAEKWIPLQGVKRGEIHIQITKRNPELEKKSSIDSESTPTKLHHKISKQMKQMMIKIQSLIDDSDLEGVSKSLRELETLHDTQEEYMVQLETEKKLLIDKINELGQEVFNSSPLSRRETIAR